jgi:ribonuclease BN (tRNA processing enzyme)
VIRLHLLGCGDAFSAGGRLQTTFLLETPAEGSGGAPYESETVERWLIDCGATALTALKRAGVSTAALDGVLVSHLHGDHFGGLPFVLLDAAVIARRERPLTLAGPPGLGGRLVTVAEALYPGLGEPPFAVEEVTLAEGVPSTIGGLTVTPFPAVHPSGAPPFMLRIEVAGRTIAFSGDTGWTEALFRLAEGADLLICECSTFARPHPYHLDYVTLAARRGELGCRRLILTHLGADVLERAAAGEVEIETAFDGMAVEI